MLALLVCAGCVASPAPEVEVDTTPHLADPPTEAPLPPGTPDSTRKPIRLTIREPQDAAEVTARVGALVVQPAPRSPVEIHIDAERLDGLVLQLGSVGSGDMLDIAVRGREGGTVLGRSRLSLVGHDVDVADLSFVGSAPAGDCLSVTVSGDATLEGLTFAGQSAPPVPSTRRRGARVRRGALELRAMGRDARASVSRLAVVDARLSPAVRIGAQPNGRFTRVDLADSVFSSVLTPAIGVSATGLLSLDHVRSDAPEGLVAADSPAVLVDGAVSATDPGDPAIRAARATAATPP